MFISDKNIDNGKSFDWGRTSEDYARYRDIYPEIFYRKITDLGLCVNGQEVLDIGTGTGVLPRNMYRFGAKWTGTDISPEQIAAAERLSAAGGMDITYFTMPTEELDFPEGSFDVITACQCFWYFDHKRVVPMLHRFLKPGGRLVLLYMAWLPYEDEIARASENIVLKYSPEWSGAGETRKPIGIPEVAWDYFDLEYREEYDLSIPFTRESWHGRMKACRGIGASLSGEELAAWEREHWEMLRERAPESFNILHYAAIAVLKRK